MTISPRSGVGINTFIHLGEALCGIAAQQFVNPILWSTIKLAETGVNLEPIVNDSGADSLRARHFAAGDKFLEHGPPDADITRSFVGVEAARREVNHNALASHAAALSVVSIMERIIRKYDICRKF